jgi:hypothetical protein
MKSASYFVISTLSCVSAWGGLGHETAALLATNFLSSKAANAVSTILSPGATLGSVASWADQIRDNYQWSSPLHFVSPPQKNDVELCGNGNSFFDSGCVKKGCIITAIQNYTQILAGFSPTGKNSTREEREEALKFLVHFLGDIHQPLHTTGRYTGGNEVDVMFDKQTTNQNGKLSLHNVWDGQMINKMVGSSSKQKQTFVDGLLKRSLSASELQAINSCSSPIKLPSGSVLPRSCPLDWASFSNAVTCNPGLKLWSPTSYQQTQDLYTNGYYMTMQDVLSQQILVAGMRLGNLLNDVLDPPTTPASSSDMLYAPLFPMLLLML